MSSQVLREARKYEELKEQTIAQKERPLFHLSSRVGWMNDPNGFSYYAGKYHLFYQYHPYEYRHKEGEKSYVDGIEIVLTMPEYMSFEKVKASMNYLFEDMCPLPEETVEKKPAKKYQPER